MTTPNVPHNVAALVPRFASLHELDTVYGVEDMYDMLEVAAVAAQNHNDRVRRDAAGRGTR